MVSNCWMCIRRTARQPTSLRFYDLVSPTALDAFVGVLDGIADKSFCAEHAINSGGLNLGETFKGACPVLRT